MGIEFLEGHHVGKHGVALTIGNLECSLASLDFVLQFLLLGNGIVDLLVLLLLHCFNDCPHIGDLRLRI